jgi:hypothetical protein
MPKPELWQFLLDLPAEAILFALAGTLPAPREHPQPIALASHQKDFAALHRYQLRGLRHFADAFPVAERARITNHYNSFVLKRKLRLHHRGITGRQLLPSPWHLKYKSAVIDGEAIVPDRFTLHTKA